MESNGTKVTVQIKRGNKVSLLKDLLSMDRFDSIIGKGNIKTGKFFSKGIVTVTTRCSMVPCD